MTNFAKIFKRSSKILNFLKIRLIINIFFCFWIFVNNFLHISRVHILKNKRSFKDALLGLKQFFAAERPSKMMKNAFYSMSKAFLVLKIFKFMSWLFGHVAKRLYKKDQVNFNFYDVTVWLTNNCNTHFAQYLEK